MEVSRYIHLNPVRLRRYADFPDAERIKALEDFKESSFPGYFRPEKRKEFVNYRTILDYRGGDTPRGREAYREFVLSGIGMDMGSLLKVGKGTGIIGDEPFIEWVKAAFLAEKGSCREQPELNVLRKEYGPDDLIDRFARLIGKPRAEICARGKQAPERAMLMELLHRFCHVSQPRIGELVGGLDYSAVSRARKRMRDRMEKDNQFREHFNKLLSKLTEKSRVNSKKTGSNPTKKQGQTLNSKLTEKPDYSSLKTWSED